MIYYNIINQNINEQKLYGVSITKEKRIENISNNYFAIKNLVDVCNSAQVDFEHFEDVLENFIEDYETF